MNRGSRPPREDRRNAFCGLKAIQGATTLPCRLLAFLRQHRRRWIPAYQGNDGMQAVRCLPVARRALLYSLSFPRKRESTGIDSAGQRLVANRREQSLITKIETMDKPWIATLYGYCFGGGLEFPLGCHFRLAAEEGAKIGLPEFHIGSLPIDRHQPLAPRVILRGPEDQKKGLVPIAGQRLQ